MNSIFYNADYVVIEYNDLIKSPYLCLLTQIKMNPNLRKILKIEDIEFLSEAGLHEWYINRKNQNFLIDLNKYPESITKETLDDILDDQMRITSKFYEYAQPLMIMDAIKVILKKKLCNQIIIYHPHSVDYVRNDLSNIIGNDGYIVMNNFEEVLEKAKSNSTYFLSDIDKILTMDEKGYLKMSSITLPIEYRYNKKNMKDFRIDFDDLYKKSPFKLTFYRACSYVV